MDNSDVEMEDVVKKVPASDGQASNESPLKYENSVKTEDPNSNSKSGAKNCINGENGVKEQKNSSIMENECNANDRPEDQSDSNGSEIEDQLNSRSQPEAPGNVVDDDKNSTKIDSQGPDNAKSDADDNITQRSEEQNQNKNENGERELEGTVVLQNKEPITDASDNLQMPDDEVHKIDKGEVKEDHQSEKIIYEVNQNGNDMMVDKQKDPQFKTNPATVITDGDTSIGNTPKPATPKFLGKPSKNMSTEAKMADDEDEYEDGDDEGSPEDQAAFIRKLESFYRERAMEFKPPKFYGRPLNCLKLWRSVIRLGGYDRVTGSKLWRQVGESFNPPKTCTTVSFTFRIFYEKALLEYERHKTQTGELQLPIPPPDSLVVDNEVNLCLHCWYVVFLLICCVISTLLKFSKLIMEILLSFVQGSGYQAYASGRARRDSAARAMQGWHEQRRLGYREVGEPIVKNTNNMPKREKNLKNIGSLKHKRQYEVENSVKATRTETSKQLVTTVVDVGPPADWVKINIRETKDCFEVYALVPGLLREEVRVQSDPAGRLVITGQPEQLDNPWGITAFKKVVSLPARIDPLQTSAVVSLHGRLFVRVPFARSKTLKVRPRRQRRHVRLQPPQYLRRLFSRTNGFVMKIARSCMLS